jgi:hypothetical protein
MDLNSALREEFDALKKSSAAHSIPHAQLQAAWARTMERALESLERKDEAIERYREKEEELERKIETLSEEVGRWKEAMAEEEKECTLAVKKYREIQVKYQNIQDVLEYAIESNPNFRAQLCEPNERMRESQKTSYRGEGPSPLWKGIFDAKKPDLLNKLLRTDAREKDEYTGETVKALGSNEIKFLYRTHPDSRNALKKLKVPIPGRYIYLQFPEECSAREWAQSLYEEHELSLPGEESSGRFLDEVHEWIQGDLGLL